MSGLKYVLVILSLSHTASPYDINVVSIPMAWNQAREACQQYGSELLTIKSSNRLNHLINILGNPSNKASFWVGALENRQRWIWAHEHRDLIEETVGCFEDNFHDHVYTNFTQNHPAICSGFCRTMMHKQFSGLKGQKCYCFYDTENHLFRDQSMCNIRCPGNEFQTCGGEKAISFYHNWDIVSWGLHEPSGIREQKDCAYILLTSEGRIEWYSGACNEKRKYICKINSDSICSWTNQTKPCYHVMEEKHTWFDARKRCFWAHGFLADGEIETMSKLNLGKDLYWAGLSRVNRIWIDGSRVDFHIFRQFQSKVNDISSCLALEYDNLTQKWSLVSRFCLESLGFICNSDTVPAPMNINISSNHNNRNGEKQTEHIHHKNQSKLIWMTCGAVTLLILPVILVINKWRKHKKLELKKKKHFYFVLEKLPLYSRRAVVNSTHNSKQLPQSYDHLYFSGTLKNAISKREITLTVDEMMTSVVETMHTSCYDVIGEPYETINAFSIKSDFPMENIYDVVNLK